MANEYQTRAIIVFADIEGFGSFTQRVSYPDVEFRPFIRQFNELINEFEKKTGYFVKRLGDGFMGVVELPKTEGRQRVESFLVAIWELTNAINSLISKKHTPRPEGFRSRMACGYIWKTIGDDNREDYLGYHVNLCQKILRVHKKERIIFCQQFRELLTPAILKKCNFKIKRVPAMDNIPDGVYKEDMNSLCALIKRK